MARLTKRDVEVLMDTYDLDPVEALGHALGKVLDRPGADFDDLIGDATIESTRRDRLRARDLATLDALAAELNERRGLD